MYLCLISTNLKCVMDAFFKNEFTASIYKIERWPRDTQKVIYLFCFWVENMLSPNIWDWNPILNTWYLRLPLGSVVSSRFRNNLCEDVLFRIRSNYYYFCITFHCLPEKFWVDCFLLNASLNISFIYWCFALRSF